MKKAAGIFLFLTVWFCPAWAWGDSPFSLSSLSLTGGFFHGTVSEEVFYYLEPLSRLDWETKWVPRFSLEGRYFFGNFYVSLNILGALPADSGAMEDFDFFENDSSVVSHYSRHTARTDWYFSGALEAGRSFVFFHDRVNLEPLLGLRVTGRKWSGRDGYIQYPAEGVPWTGEEPQAGVRGKVIDYRQLIWIPFLGFGAGFRPFNFLLIRGGFRFAPVVFVRALDNHYLKNSAYLDVISRGFFLEARLAAEVFPFKKRSGHAFRLEAEYAYLRARYGKIYHGTIGHFPENPAAFADSQSGSSGGLWNFSLGYVLYL